MKPGSDLEIAPDGEVFGSFEGKSYARHMWWIGGGALVLAAAIVAYFLLVYDIDPPEDADLKVEWIDYLDVRHNAYPIWREGIEELGISEETRDGVARDSSEWEPAHASEMRAGFTRLLDRVEKQFTAHPPERFVFHRDHRSGFSDYESYLVFIELGPFSSFRKAGILSGETVPREALEECVRFGRLFAAFRFENLGGVPLWLFDKEFSIIDAALEGLPATELDAGFREDIEVTLALWRARLDEVEQSYPDEYQRLCDAFDHPDFRKDFRLSRTFKKNMTKALLADATRERMRDLGRNHEGYPQIKNLWEYPAGRFPGLTDLYNQDGIQLASEIIGEYNFSFRFRIRLEALAALLEVKLALGAYIRENEGAGLPESLEALVPAYLDAVPIDPFDGEPVRFKREKKTVYCVGRDLIDGGGDFETPSKGKDFGLRVDWDGVADPGGELAP